MSLESDLYTVLSALCPRVFPDAASATTATPYVTWQQIGAEAVTFTEGTLADSRNARVQINVWDKSRASATTLMLQIESAFCAASQFQARPDSAHMASMDDDTDLRGCSQDFSIWADR